MSIRYAVGMTVDAKSRQVEIEAEDALIAALRAKAAQPDALIVYVRKSNARGDKRHPHPAASEAGGGRQAGLPTRARSGKAAAPRTAAPARTASKPPRQPRRG